VIHTAPLFKTTDDVANRDEVAAYETEALDLVGLRLHADQRPSTRKTGGLNFVG
jgi:hypothetical protein